ncbi:hypothetical protein I316_07971 [Kwoniella heveanensis BCC8398]|uniref:Uncharacterized protein n=1 Tax=Kwoniella heveanensis BCC8398 TaxID=1296120 RepID=A0A1B9GH91_9TREE|nr:hypothetical protein I316_07971 [Kwoniella heveanensis BCC8398]
MSANPPIRGIPTHESDSPSLLIQRYLSSLPPTFSPDIRLYSQSAHPSRFRSQSRQPQHQPDINRILRSPPPSRTGHQSTLSHGNHPQSSVQGDKLVPVENKQPSTRKRLLADIGDEATPDISKSIRRSKGQDVSKGSKGLRGHRVQGAPLRRETSRIQHEENKEDTERREARKVRRREKAAILDPSPPTSPPRHPSLINVDFNREARSSKHNGQTGSEVGRTKNKMDTFRHRNVRKGRRSGVFDERDIIRKYKPVNIFPNTGRLTLGTKEGFLGLGKSSERIILPGARNESITGKGSRWDRYGGINRAEYAPLHGHRTPPLKYYQFNKLADLVQRWSTQCPSSTS